MALTNGSAEWEESLILPATHVDLQIFVFPTPGDSSDAPKYEADAAMYAAKRARATSMSSPGVQINPVRSALTIARVLKE